MVDWFNNFYNNLDKLSIYSFTLTIFTISYVIYSTLDKFNLENKYILKIKELEIKIKESNQPDLEFLSDINVDLWNALIAKSIFEMYKNTDTFKNLLNFSESDFLLRLFEKGEVFNNLEKQIDFYVDDLFVNSKYNDYYTYNSEIAKYETKYYFNKIRFLYSDVVLNEFILENNPSYFYNLREKANMLAMFDEYNFRKPYSMDIGYTKSLKNTNFYKKPNISSFKN